MQVKSNIDIKNIIRMREIAEVYETTGQEKKSQKYHRNIIKICDTYPQSDETLIFKISSQNHLKKSYKSPETTNEHLKINPNNIAVLLNRKIFGR